MGRRTSIIGMLLRASIIAAAAVACASSLTPNSHGGQSGALDLSGVPIDPFKASPGKVVVLVFVRTDCPISNRYSPAIQRISAARATDTSFWLIYPDKAESPNAIRKHQNDFGYTLPALRDVRHELVRLSHAQITPEAAVFDAHRRLIYHGRIDNLYEDIGRARTAATTHELEDAIQAALNGKALPSDTAPAVGCYISDLE
jgi:hypothetical protein